MWIPGFRGRVDGTWRGYTKSDADMDDTWSSAPTSSVAVNGLETAYWIYPLEPAYECMREDKTIAHEDNFCVYSKRAVQYSVWDASREYQILADGIFTNMTQGTPNKGFSRKSSHRAHQLSHHDLVTEHKNLSLGSKIGILSILQE